jgi:hypothetical protein
MHAEAVGFGSGTYGCLEERSRHLSTTVGALHSVCYLAESRVGAACHENESLRPDLGCLWASFPPLVVFLLFLYLVGDHGKNERMMGNANYI